MKNNFRKSVSSILVALVIGVPSISHAHKGYDPLHTAKIESIASMTAHPVDIHVEKTDGGIIVTGLIKRNLHNSVRLRGSVDVAILDENGANIGDARKKIRKGNTKAHRNSSARFKVVLPLPKSEKYTIKVSHMR